MENLMMAGILDLMGSMGNIQNVGEKFAKFIEDQSAALRRIEQKQDEILARLDTLERVFSLEMMEDV